MAAATFSAGCEEPGDRRHLEADFLDLLIASERVGDLVDAIRETSNPSRRKQAVRELAKAVRDRETFAVEARVAGAVDVFTSLIKLHPGDEELVELACRIITVCSGTIACGGKVHELHFGKLAVHLREGSLADGLGARMWAISRSLSSMLVERPQLVRGREVLEIGAGTGLCGIVAAKLGASKVVLTDCEEAVLLNLRECAAANASADRENRHTPPAAAARKFPSQAAQEDHDFDPEDADECEDLDDFLCQAASAKSSAAQGSNGHRAPLQWDLDNMEVRYMNWETDLQRLHSRKGPAQQSQDSHNHPEWLKDIPQMEDSATFEIILGSDVLYEEPEANDASALRIHWLKCRLVTQEQHAEMVAVVLKSRLRPDGTALIALAIRDEALYAKLLEQCKAQGLAVHIENITDPGVESNGIMGHARDYHGFVALTITHAKQ